MRGYDDNFLNSSFRSNWPKISSSRNYWNPRNCKTWLTRQTSLWRRVEHPPTRSWWSSSSSSSSKWSRQSAPLSSKSKINLTPKVIVLHREYTQGGSIGVTLAGGADYESKEITVIHHLSLKQFSMVIYMRVYPCHSIFSFRCTRWSQEAWRTVTVGSRKEIESSRSTGGARRGSAIGRRSVSSRYGMWCRSDCCYLHHRDPPARFGDFHKHRAPPFYWVPSMVSTHHNRSACRVLFYSLQWRPFIMFLLTLWRSRVRRWSLLCVFLLFWR